MKPSVFISHSSKDRLIAQAVCFGLEEAGIRCWIAPRDVDAGQSYAGEITRGIRMCHVFVLIFSNNSNQSEHVVREVELAVNAHCHILRVRLEDIKLNDDLEFFLNSRQWLDALTPPLEHHIHGLVAVIKPLLAMDKPMDSPPTWGGVVEAPPPRRRKQGPKAAVLVVAALAILGVLVYAFMPSRSTASHQPAETASAGPPTSPVPQPLPTPAPKPDELAALSRPAPPVAPSTPVPLVALTTPAPPVAPTTPAPPIETPPKKIGRHAGSPSPGKATKSAPFINSLGMEFVPVPGTRVLFCRWHTRIRDWKAFVAQAGDPTPPGMFVAHPLVDTPVQGMCLLTEQEDPKASWKNPGFPQTDNHPIAGVNYQDAKLFCEWLSKEEGLTYRLPTDAEWTAATNGKTYPWGEQYPPPTGAGNFADDSFARLLPMKTFQLPSDDGYPRTAPVGSFAPNGLGLYDLGGNLWEICADEFRVSMNDLQIQNEFIFLKFDHGPDGAAMRLVRGSSWGDCLPDMLRCRIHMGVFATVRVDNVGFRVVLALPEN